MNNKIEYNPCIDDVILTPIMGFDTEFNDLDTKHAKLIAFSLTNSDGVTYVFDCTEYIHKVLVEFFRKLASLDKLICHNTKAEIGVIYSNLGVLLKNCWCTMLASQIIDNGYGYQVSEEKLLERGGVLPDDYEDGKLYYTNNMVGGIEYMQSPHGLIGCIKRYLGKNLIGLKQKKEMQWSFINYDFKQPLTKQQLDYAAEDTTLLIDLYNAQLVHIKERQLQRIVNLENKLTPVLVKMEARGCKINIPLHKENINKWKDELEKITNQLDAIVLPLRGNYPGISKFAFNRNKTIVNQVNLFDVPTQIVTGCEAFNYSSTKQLAQLFEACSIPPPTLENKVSFGEESIALYITNNPENIFVEFLDLLLKYREYEKLLGTYSEKLLDNLDGDRIRTSYSQCWTDTGRLSSAEIKKGRGLNLANIPKNKDIRKIFIPDDGYVFVDSDMTGQELVIAADFSGDPVLLKAFQEGFDHHSFLATISYSLIFGKKVEIEASENKFTVGKHEYKFKDVRQDHKICLFSKIYLGGPKRIQVALNKYLVNHVQPKDRFNVCKKISNALDTTLKTLIDFLKSKVESTKQDGYTLANKLGRRRYFDNPNEVYGDAANVCIQGTGADAMKIAMVNIDRFFEEKAKELNLPEQEIGYLTLSIYDQVLVNLNAQYLHLKDEIPKIMGDAITYFLKTLKGSSDLNIREYWSK